MVEQNVNQEITFKKQSKQEIVLLKKVIEVN